MMKAFHATLAVSVSVFGIAPLMAQRVIASAAPAQSGSSPAAAASNNLSDIIVTARKRQESLINVPVIVNAVSGVQLQRTGTVDLKDLTKFAPGLLIGTSVLSIGQLVSIRGVGTSSTDPGIDQSVSLNIDGLSLGQGLAFSSGVFDVGQIEVLKGPQALFFGKSSPGGVISIRTADPTDKFEVIERFGYETEAHTKRNELIVSGPIGDTLKARLAGMYSATDGFYYNDATAAAASPAFPLGLGGVTPRYDREGHSKDYHIRGTLLWDPNPNFSARLKANLVHDMTVNGDDSQLASCPDGVGAPSGIPFIGSGEDCKKDRISRIVDFDPAAFPGIANNGVPFVRTTQQYGTLELSQHLSPDVTATSVTGYYHLHSSSTVNVGPASDAGPAVAGANTDFHRRDVTQELRLNSDFSSPINFTAGGFYQDGKVFDQIVSIGNTYIGLPPLLSEGINQIMIKSYSLYGQARWKILPTLELAGGARWTDETRRQLQSLLFPALPFTTPTPRIHSSRVSPEVTLTYKPTPDLTLFAAYKKGNKSGSFSIATPVQPTPAPPAQPLDNSFGDESVSGFEGGIKGRLLDRQLNFSLTGYDYKYRGLQVGAIEPSVGILQNIRTVNAGLGRAYGAELELNYHPRAIDGLNVNTSLDWNHTRFIVLNNIPCYGGQEVSEGCNQQFNAATGLYFAQDASGLPFIRAPRWQTNFGLDYELPIGKYKLIFSNSNHYSSRYLTDLGMDYFQKGFIKSDISLTLQGPSDRWEIAVIGKNVTEKLTASACNNSNVANGLVLGGQVTGGTTRGPAGVDEVGCYMDPGRELWLRVTFRPFS